MHQNFMKFGYFLLNTVYFLFNLSGNTDLNDGHIPLADV